MVLSSWEMNLLTQVQILNNVAYISYSTNTFWKGMNSSILSSYG